MQVKSFVVAFITAAALSGPAVSYASEGATLAGEPSASAPAPYEPNNSRAEAFGPVGLTGSSTLSAGLESEGDTDVFFAYVRSGQQPLHVAVTNTSKAGARAADRRLAVTLLDDRGVVLSETSADGVAPGFTVSLDVTVAGPAAVFVVVRSAQLFGPAGALYSLTAGPVNTFTDLNPAQVKCQIAQQRQARTQRSLRKAKSASSSKAVRGAARRVRQATQDAQKACAAA